MKHLFGSIGLAALVALSAPAHAVHGGSDAFLWQIVKESDFCLLYIAGDEKGMHRCTGSKDDKIDAARDYEGGENDGNDDDGDDGDE